LNGKSSASQLLTEHFRCPEDFIDLEVSDGLSAASGFFRLGSDCICFGQTAQATPAAAVTDTLPDLLSHVSSSATTVRLPFDPVETLENLRHEHYFDQQGSIHAPNKTGTLIRKLYYLARPLMPVALRKHLQRVYLRNWEDIPFPKWPVDFSVENILESILILSMQSKNLTRIPFIWFWPEGVSSCTAVTHDVEEAAGWEFCSQLMDIDDSFGIKSAFQIVPEERYGVTDAGLNAFRERGFEINVHDLNHDGNLLMNREEFLRRAAEINHYKETFQTQGFRTAILYRKVGLTPWTFPMTCRCRTWRISSRSEGVAARSFRFSMERCLSFP
jgi:hypothetical protein